MNMYKGAFLGPYCCPPMPCGLFEFIIMCLLDTCATLSNCYDSKGI